MNLKIIILSLAVLPMSASYQNLIATEDGTRVFFTAPTSIAQSGGFVARLTSNQPVGRPISDTDGGGNIVATTGYGTRTCASGLGSTCFIQSYCAGDFSIQGNGVFWSDLYHSAFIRFNRKGDVVWLQKTHDCPVFGIPSVPLTDGFYDVASRQLLISLGGTELANQRVGRRAITDTRRALVLSGNQLNWLDQSGLHFIPTATGVFEAVTDASGANIVYSEIDGGTLHWISNGQDQQIGFAGAMPALTADGSTLVFLDSAHIAQAYSRQSATIRPLSQNAIGTFTLGGNFVFAVNGSGQLIRIDLATAQQITWLEASPEIDSFVAMRGLGCPLVCYGPQEPDYFLAPGMIVVLKGKGLNRTTLTATLADAQIAVTPLSGSSAFFQVPQATPVGVPYRQTITIRDNSSPVVFATTVLIVNQTAVCLATVHQDFTTLVTPDDPAVAGEIVHEFLTGLPNPEAIPNGVPNPTDRLVPISSQSGLIDPAIADTLFLGLAPGQIGLDQLDLLVKSPSYSGCNAAQ